MDESRSDIFQKLEDAVEQWSAQVSSAQEILSQRLERTRVHIDAASGETAAPAEPAVSQLLMGQYEALQRLLERFADAAKQAAAQLANLNAEVRALRDELRATHEQPAASAIPGDALEELRGFFVAAQEDNRALRDELAALRSELSMPGHSAEGVSEAVQAADGTWEEVARLRAQLDDEPDAAPVQEPRVPLALEAFDSAGTRRRLGEILVEAGIITSEQLEAALNEQEQLPQRRLGQILVERGFTGEHVIAQVLACQIKSRFVYLDEEPVEGDALQYVNARLARRHECLPLRASTDRLVVAMANPFDLIAIDDIELASGLRVDPVVATTSDLRQAIERNYGV